MNVTVLRNPLSREKWVSRITTAWQKQVTDIFEVGTLLEAAKAELKHGEWLIMVKDELPFNRQTAFKLIKIAACDHLRGDDVSHAKHLPAHWDTLYHLASLTEEQFDHGIKTGVINPKMQRKDVKALRGDDKKTEVVKPSKAKDFDELCGDFALDIDRTAKNLPKEQRHEFLILLRGIVDSLLQKEPSNG